MGQETGKRPTRRGNGREKQEGSSAQNPLLETEPHLCLFPRPVAKWPHAALGLGWELEDIPSLEIETTQQVD